MDPQLGAASDSSGREGGKVIGLVVLIKYLLSGCACTNHLDWVAQHTVFQDFEILLCRAVRSRELKVSLFNFSYSCLGVILLCLYCVLRYTTARLQVLFSSHRLGGITKGCSNNYHSKSLLLYIYLLTLTQLYSNLVYNKHNTTYLCLVLDVLSFSKDLKGQACLAMHSASLSC